MPYASTDQANGMPFGPSGLVPGLNAAGQIENIATTFNVVAKTSAYTVKTTESGTIFTTQGATAAVTFTLPATANCAGCLWIFYNCEDVNMTVTAGTVDTMTAINDVAADSVAFSTSSLKIGGGMIVFGDGTSVHAMILPGQAIQTVTVATN
jgi:hypothetical protein